MADWQTVARRKAAKYGLDPGTFVRQIRQESGGRDVRSPAGAQGPAQFMPGTAASVGLNSRTVHELDPSLDAAAKLMASYVRKFGSYRNALVAYNAGPGAVGRGSLPSETRNYINVILGGRNPSTGGVRRSSGSTGGSTSGGGTSTTRTVTTTTPGVDNRLARASLIQSFLDSHSSIDPLDFAMQARQLQDVAPTSTTRTTRSSTPGGDVRAAGHGAISPQGAGSSFAKSHSPLLELIHKTSSGPGYAVKNGKVVNGPQVFSSVWDGHADHVHVAAGPKTVVEIGRMAQKMGLHVGENPHFGGVNPVHVPGSYHYRGEAIDVSGDPGRMNHFAAEVERLYGLR